MAATHIDISLKSISIEMPYKTDSYALIHTQKFAQKQISPAKAKSIALSRIRGGEYVDLRKTGNFYIVRVRTRDGRIVDIKIDATTGRVK